MTDKQNELNIQHKSNKYNNHHINKNPFDIGMNIGITTIITTFVILCMVTFATLSYVNVLNDYKLTSALKEHNDSYYAAVSNANQLIADTVKTIAAARLNDTFDTLQSSYTYNVPVDSAHSLIVVLEPVDSNQLYRLTQYAVHTTIEWQGDDTLPLLENGD